MPVVTQREHDDCRLEVLESCAGLKPVALLLLVLVRVVGVVENDESVAHLALVREAGALPRGLDGLAHELSVLRAQLDKEDSGEALAGTAGHRARPTLLTSSVLPRPAEPSTR